MYLAGRNTPAPIARLEDVNNQYFFKMSNYKGKGRVLNGGGAWGCMKPGATPLNRLHGGRT